jgi:uncharacterized protein YkwD
MAKKKKQKNNSQITFKHFFIPHNLNDYRPHAFRHKMLTLYSFILLTSQVLMGITFYSGPSLAQGSAELMKDDIIKLTSVERVVNGQGELGESDLLSQAAKQKLDDMFQNNYWDHVSPTGTEAWDFIKNVSYDYQYAGENLGKGFIDAKSVVAAWMASESHKKNILNPNYNEIGVAVGQGTIDGKPTVLIVQLFGAQKASAVAAAKYEGTSQTISKAEISRENLVIDERLPYFVMWMILFGLIVFDGVMLRKRGLHKSKKHLFQFRAALVVNILVLVLLSLNYVSIS